GTGTGATFQTGVFGVNTVTVTTAGNYTVLPANPAAQASTSGSGTGATFTMDWGILAATVSAAGSGYGNDTVLVISGGGGTGATATFTKKVTGITIVDGGSGYDITPTITITGDGSGATATATISNGAINSTTVTAAGTGYTVAGAVASGGIGAEIIYNIFGTAYHEIKVTETVSALATTINAL